MYSTIVARGLQGCTLLLNSDNRRLELQPKMERSGAMVADHMQSSF